MQGTRDPVGSTFPSSGLGRVPIRPQAPDLPSVSRACRGIDPANAAEERRGALTALSDSRTISDRSFLIDDAARVLGISRRTVYYRIREGRLRTIRTRCGSQRVLLSSMEVLLREGAGEAIIERLDSYPGSRSLSRMSRSQGQ
jgi:excisionase family DNA binding protein